MPAGRDNLMCRQGRSGGFTLIELLISIGILAVGLAMIAAVFPTAIAQTKSSVDDVIGMNICKNTLAVVRARLISGNVSGASDTQFTNLGPDFSGASNTDFPTMAYDLAGKGAVKNGQSAGGTTNLTEADMAYSIPRVAENPPGSTAAQVVAADWWGGSNPQTLNEWRPMSRHGCIVLARKAASSSTNDFQFVLISYNKKQGSNPERNAAVVAAIAVNCDEALNRGVSVITPDNGADLQYFQRGTPVILGGDTDVANQLGTFAYAKQITSDGQIVLDRLLKADSGSYTFTNVTVLVVYEAWDQAGAGTVPVVPANLVPLGTSSPVMSVLVTRSGLRQ